MCEKEKNWARCFNRRASRELRVWSARNSQLQSRLESTRRSKILTRCAKVELQCACESCLCLCEGKAKARDGERETKLRVPSMEYMTFKTTKRQSNSSRRALRETSQGVRTLRLGHGLLNFRTRKPVLAASWIAHYVRGRDTRGTRWRARCPRSEFPPRWRWCAEWCTQDGRCLQR